MLTALIPWIVCFVGLLMYLLSGTNPPGNPKVSAIGFACFWVGLFVGLLQLAQMPALHFGR